MEQKKKAPIGWLIAGVVLGIVIIASFLLLYSPTSPISRVVNPPRPEVTSLYGYDTFLGADYIFVVEVTVRNNGGEGWVKVYAEISGAGKYEKQETRIYIGSGESMEVTYTFDITLWGAITGGAINYRAWAVAD